MKKILALFIAHIMLLSTLVTLRTNAAIASYSIDSILISPDGKTLLINCTVPESSQNSYFLFRTLSENENINNLTPISESSQVNGKLCFTVNYDSSDHSLALYGYCIGASDNKSGFVKLTKTHYINNISAFSHNNTPIKKSGTKKGLEVQYISDAQLLGIGHTVIHVYLNDIIADENDDNAYAYIYGDLKYYLNSEALTLLDYRIKTLTDAGINVYINFLLAFDSNANPELYYPNAKGDGTTLFAPNVSSPDTLNQYAATIHHIAERYSSGDKGFCGNYIIGYEVNNEVETNSCGISLLKDYVLEYGRFLRISYLALTSAYSDARIFVSVSNRFNIPISDSKAGFFGAKEFLVELIEKYSDIPFGVSINAYPSDLQMTDFWNDPKATFSFDTEYVTMKNIDVLTELINSIENDPYNNKRQILISEFGLSGIKGDKSEAMQAAAYAYAYYIADNNPYIDALIWHRHVDHSSEIGLCYGLFSSTDIILDASEKKLIHAVMEAVNNSSTESISLIKEMLKYLPINDYSELIRSSEPNRTTNTISSIDFNHNPTAFKKRTLFDFSRNLYSFYPTDNTEYIDLVSSENGSYMRIATVMMSSTEYMGAGASVSLSEDVLSSKYITIQLRVVSSSNHADFALVMSDGSDLRQMSALVSKVKTNEWITLTFPLHDIKTDDLNISSIKLWVRDESSENEQIYLDVSNISLINSINNTHITALTIIISAAIACAITSLIILLINRYKEQR